MRLAQVHDAGFILGTYFHVPLESTQEDLLPPACKGIRDRRGTFVSAGNV